MSKVSLRISNLPNAAGSASRKRVVPSSLEGSDLVVDSALSPEAPVNDHLVWMWGMLKHERRYLKSLQAEGAVFTINVPARHGVVEVKPNGAEMLHLLGITLMLGGS
jgi:hypothetical protein